VPAEDRHGDHTLQGLPPFLRLRRVDVGKPTGQPVAAHRGWAPWSSPPSLVPGVLRSCRCAGWFACPIAQGVQGQRRMGVGPPGPHLGGDPNRLHDLFRACPLAARELGVPGDAIGALRHVGGRHGDQLLGLLRQGAIGEDGAAEVLERVGAGYMPSAIGPLRSIVLKCKQWIERSAQGRQRPARDLRPC
jgi:hypothetical protein